MKATAAGNAADTGTDESSEEELLSLCSFMNLRKPRRAVILIGVQTEVGDDVEASLDELEELAETAGAETVSEGDPEQRGSPSWNLYRQRQD